MPDIHVHVCMINHQAQNEQSVAVKDFKELEARIFFCFSQFGPHQCSVAPGVNQQLLADLFCLAALASYPVSTASFFVYWGKKLAVETGYEAKLH